MAILVAIIDVGAAVILDILARALNPIVKTAALEVVKLCRRSFPIAPIPILAIYR